MKKETFLYIVFVLASSKQLYAADDYLSILENESSHTQIDSATNPADVMHIQKQKALAGFTTKRLPTNLNKTDFKIFLMNNLFDSYMSYLELDKEKKEFIFQQYQQSQTPKVNVIEGLINRLSK